LALRDEALSRSLVDRGVARQTVESHINTVEIRLGRVLSTCTAELEMASLEELDPLDGTDDPASR
jgi:hypothetical protein